MVYQMDIPKDFVTVVFFILKKKMIVRQKNKRFENGKFLIDKNETFFKKKKIEKELKRLDVDLLAIT